MSWIWQPLPAAQADGATVPIAAYSFDDEEVFFMRKNTASQNFEGQMNARANGDPLTASASIFVTGDNGTQTAGAGTLAHKGNGAWNYAPTQAETNFNHIAFTFVHATGVIKTYNVFTYSYDPHNVTTLGLANLDAAVGTRMATYTQPAGFLAATFPTGTVSNTTNITAATGVVLSAAGVQAIWDAAVTALTVVGSIGKRIVDFLTGDAFVRIGAPVGASISADIAAVQADTDNIQTRIPAALVGGRTDASVGAMATGVVTAAAVAAAALNDKGNWNIGKTAYSLSTPQAFDNTGNITGNLSGSVGSVAGAVGSVTGSVGSVTGAVGSVTGAVGSVTARVTANTDQINGSATSANRLQKSTAAITFCTVGAASTATSIVTSAMDPAAAVIDQFKGKIVSFASDTTTVNLRGQSTDITGNTAVGVLTVTALSTAPVSGDTFVIT